MQVRADFRLLEVIGYRDFSNGAGPPSWQGCLMGIGISTYAEICGVGLPGGGWESATVRVEPAAAVKMLTGSSQHGQGEDTR